MNSRATDGRLPRTALTQGADDALYGVTPSGGANDQGVAFQITLAGSYAVLRDFETGDRLRAGGAAL